LAGFSLVEVVLGLGIFSIAVLGILALIGPTLEGTGDTLNRDQASQVSEAVGSQVQQISFSSLREILAQDIPLYASRNGDRLVSSRDAALDQKLPPEERFFEVTLDRNTDWSPQQNDSSSAYLALQVRIEWVAFRPDGMENTAAGSRTLAVFNTAVLRNEN